MSRRILDLNGDSWALGQAPAGANPGQAAWHELDRVEEWLPATVPGNVRADLLRAGRLPDLAVGTQLDSAQWADDHCWWLTRNFALPRAPSDRVHLVLRGLDYIGDLFVNGHHLGRHEGMFSPQVHEVTHLLAEENRLAVRVLGSRWLPQDRSNYWEKFLNQLEAKAGGLPGYHPHRRDTLKCQMGFGWDFAPPLRTMGLWDDVYAVMSRKAYIQDVRVRQRPAGSGVVLTIATDLDTICECAARIRCTLRGETFEGEFLVVERPVALAAGRSRQSVELEEPQPYLWWPWDQGYPHLYRLCVEVWSENRLLDSCTQTIGFRQVELDDWTLYINGQRVFARGANWVPADILPGRVTRNDYRELLTLARKANMNMVRIWGGGLREKRALYDLCDRLGIMVWQEFPIACAYLTRYPRSPEYLHLLKAEARAIVRDLRSHPSVVLWCGGNEFSPRRNKPLVTVLEEIVAAEDPSRPFLPASPGGGDRHNWRVWHQFAPPQVYCEDGALFASEFGLQALPHPDTLRSFLPQAELESPGPSWTYHGANLKKLQRYARPFQQAGERSVETLIEASQRAQSNGLQIAVEHYRRRKAQGCGGALVWQLNEPWPAISWALVDHFRRPKLAYETIARLFNPVLISLDYMPQRFGAGRRFGPAVWIVNDRPEAFPGCRVEIALWNKAHQRVLEWVHVTDIAADSAEVVGHLTWILPPDSAGLVTCRLTRDGEVLGVNEYDLDVYDGIQATPLQRLRAWITGLLLST
jgi:beta-mannosidase